MTPIEMPIAAVTVYTDRARVTRSGRLTLPAGEHTLSVGGLPAGLDSDSVRAGGRGEGVRLLGVEVATEYVTTHPEAGLEDLQRELEEAQEADRALLDETAARQAHLDFLAGLRQEGSSSLARGLSRSTSTITAVEELAGYLARETAATTEALRELGRRRRELGREIAALEARLRQSATDTRHERRLIHVTVAVAGETEVELEVHYVLHGASWQPLYDIRLVGERVQVSYLAQVQQRTGESWPAVPLTISTARPAAGAGLPELMPWYIDIPRPINPPRMPAAQAAPFGGFGRTADEAPREEARMAYSEPAPVTAPIAPVQATVAQQGAAVTYRVARPTAIPSDGTPHKTTITTLDFPADLDYVTAPKLAEDAYLRAKVSNNSAFTLLPGTANIFHDAEFVAATRLAVVAPSEQFEVQLGVDSRVKVERDLTERTTGKAALIGNLKRTSFAYRVRLTNHLPTPARITVYDQLPVSRHEEIKVKLLEATPKPAEGDKPGSLEWQLTIPPAEVRELILAYAVEHPRTLTVLGLG